MTVSFDFNFWTLAIFTLNFGLALYGIASARGRASAEAMEAMRREHTRAQEEAREKHTKALEDHREKTGLTFNRLGERLQAVETHLKNSITHDDLSAVHKRVDEVHKLVSGIGSSISRVEGLLEGLSLTTKKNSEKNS